jgi:hypothetical protein
MSPAVLAQSIIRVLAVHSGNLAGRLSAAIDTPGLALPEQNKQYSPVMLESLVSEGPYPAISHWISELRRVTRIDGSTAAYVNALSVEDRQIFAEQLTDVALAVISQAIDHEPDEIPKRVRSVANVAANDWSIDASPPACLYDIPEWRSGDAGLSGRPGNFMVALEFLPRGRRLMRALQYQVREVFEATTLAEKSEDDVSTELVGIKAAGALYLIQSLNELFSKAFPRAVRDDPNTSTYELHVESCHEGRTISGLKLVRNSETHDSIAIIDQEASRLITAFYSNGFQGMRMFPVWPQYDQLPDSVRISAKTPARLRSCLLVQ